MKRINIVDVLFPFVHLSFNPMSIEVSEQVVDIFGRGSVSVPFLDVEGQERFVNVVGGSHNKLLKILVQINDKVLVEVFTKEVC